MEKNLKFTTFADLHYKKIWYAATVKDVETILKRAEKFKADFVLHEGDFCNNYMQSPELVNAYLKNNQGLKVYGVYGNHELESENNSMEFVTPLLTNDYEVVWGTKDGEIGDGSIGYYYFDKNGYRIICTDTNYSYDPEANLWKHNETNSFGPPKGYTNENALGAEQLKWLEELLISSAKEEKTCIVVSHTFFCSKWGGCSSDSDAVHELFKKVNAMHPRTVIMQISGHEHINRMETIDNIFYITVNAAINGFWKPKRTNHYNDNENQPFILTDYDENGNYLSEKTIGLGELWFAPLTHFFEEPLSANISIIGDKKIVVEGMKTNWRYNVIPEADMLRPYEMSEISNIQIELN